MSPSALMRLRRTPAQPGSPRRRRRIDQVEVVLDHLGHGGTRAIDRKREQPASHAVFIDYRERLFDVPVLEVELELTGFTRGLVVFRLQVRVGVDGLKTRSPLRASGLASASGSASRG
jgi:hypothetical protein